MPDPAKTFDWYAFSAENRARCEAPDGFDHPLDSWDLSDWMTATFGELGEAANIVKKLNRVRDGVVPAHLAASHVPGVLKSRLAEELADTFCYLDLLAQAGGIDLPQAVRDKFDIVSKQHGYRGS